MTLTVTSAREVIHAIQNGHRIIWAGWVVLPLMLLAGVAFFGGWSMLMEVGLWQSLTMLPAEPSALMDFTLAGTAMLFVGFTIWAYSFAWLQADYAFWRKDDRAHVLCSLTSILGGIFRIAVFVVFLLGLLWVNNVALAPRFAGKLFFAETGILAPGMFFTVACLVLTFPYWLRLWYAPTVGALTPDSTVSPWRVMLNVTKGRSLDLVGATLFQVALTLPVVYAFMQIAWPVTIQPIYDALTVGGPETPPELADVISSTIGSTELIGLVVWGVVSGPFISLLAVAQVAVIRTLMGIPGGSIGTESYVVGEELSRSETGFGSTTELPDVGIPQFAQFSDSQDVQPEPALSETPPELAELELPDSPPPAPSPEALPDPPNVEPSGADDELPPPLEPYQS